tara:strand:- start:37 stop:651 length:615 start_codon:yes stop_codon:yes gene_type:complete
MTRSTIKGPQDGAITFNEGSADVDFRVESNGNTDMIFVDGGNDVVYVGGATDFQGTLNVAGDGVGVGNSTSSYRRMYWNSSNTDMRFWNGSNEAIINDSGAFTDASDEKLKKDIADITYGIDVVKELKPRKYKMKATNKEQIGFIAQEVEAHVPEVITTGTNPDSVEQKGLAYGQLTAVLTKALQEAVAKIETLEAKVTALESK